MTTEDQPGVPPIDVMRQVIDENRVLVRLLSTSTIDDEPSGGLTEANALISVYREVMELVEIMNATSDPTTTANSRWSDSDQEFAPHAEPTEHPQLEGLSLDTDLMDERRTSVTNEQAGELINALRRRHDAKLEQLTSLFESDGGFEVFHLAVQVLGDAISAADWLTNGQRGLDGAIPAVLALSAEGREAVRTYLGQVEHGVYV